MTTHNHVHSYGAREKNSSPIIEFKDFCFAYEQAPILRHINLSILKGDCAVLMGHNGSGKSTLLRALNGLIFPQQGSYLFNGEEISEKTMKQASRSKSLHMNIGFIFQDSDTQLFCSSVEDEIAFGPRQMGFSEEEVRERVNDICKLLDIEEIRQRASYHLSGGEKKKVAIASVLSMNPGVYCFDEPLNNLDLKTRDWLISFMKELKSAGKTLIISTHDQSLADSLADYFIYMGPWHEYSDLPHVHINL